MTWLQFLGYLAAFMGARWALNEMTPHGDVYFFSGLIICQIGWSLYRRSRIQALMSLWFRSSDAEREALMPTLLSAVGMSPTLSAPVVAEDRLIFEYPSTASRGGLTVLFWICVVFAVGMLRPILSSDNLDPANEWMLFILGCMLALGGYWISRKLRYVGDLVIVDEFGLEVQRGKRVRERISWSEITQVGGGQSSLPLVFGAEDGRKITVWPELIDHVVFEDVVARCLIRKVRSGNGHH